MKILSKTLLSQATRLTGVIISVALMSSLFSVTHAAPNEDECVAWLCITVGFAPPQCLPAQRAMLKRLFEGKGPLPLFSSCSVDGGDSGLNAQQGIAAKMDTEPKTYRMGTLCVQPQHNSDPITPRGCVRTFRFIIATQNEEQPGDVYFTPLR